jgi:phenylpyruvate tautomerase PptA (4-oxalocrotonate tautomerase family)
MPLYTLYHPPGAFTQWEKPAIAKLITESHCSATGAGAFFVKVIFIPCNAGDIYSGGKLDDQLVRVTGVIRAGRDTSTRQKILKGIWDGLQEYLDGRPCEISLEEMLGEVSHGADGRS